MLSRKAFGAVVNLSLPFGFCEMRLPTILTAFGFGRGRLNSPGVRYRRVVSKSEVERRFDPGIFRPVHDLQEDEVVRR